MKLNNFIMKKILLFTLFGSFAVTANSQVTFQTQTSGTAQNLKGTTMIPGTTRGWAAGAGGTILYTTDGSVSWTAQASGTTATLEDIMWGASGNGGLEFVWACGSAATVTATMDGVTWAEQSGGAPYGAYAINFQGIANGIMLGDQFYARSSNGGNQYTPTITGLTYLSVDFVGSTGWATGNTGFIKKTTDGGATWVDQSSGTTEALHGIDFINVNEGWACGLGGTMLHTTDGGSTWTAQTSNTANLLSSVKFADSQNGWACGYTGTILRTVDGGTTWTTHFSGVTNTTAWLHSIALIGENEGWAVGDVGTIIHFIDAGGSSAGIANLNTVQLTIYPNPATSNLSIDTEAIIESISIYDVNGMIVQSETTKEFSIETLSTGLYILKVETTNGVISRRFAKN